MPSRVVARRIAEEKLAAEREKQRVRRSRILMIAGALLIVMTYTIKEVLRDELKTFSDSLAAAQLAESESSAQQMISAREMEMRLHLRQAQQALSDPKKAALTSKLDLTMELADLSTAYSDLASDAEHLTNLLDKLPRWIQGRDKARSEIKASVEQARQHVLSAAPKNKASGPEPMDHVMVLMGLVQVEVDWLQVAIWQDSITTTAKKWREIAEKTYSICTWAAYILFVLGVALAVIGKLHGYESVEYAN